MTHSAFPDDVAEAIRRCASAPTLLVALDFDGTLAPFTQDPADSAAVEPSQAAMDRLAQMPGTWVGIISGRTLEFLRTSVDPQHRMLLCGSHGAEFDLSVLGEGAHAQDISLTPQQSALLERAVEGAEAISRDFPGSALEYKPGGLCFHTRPMQDQSRSDEALGRMQDLFVSLEQLRITPGQQVMECSVLHATKGEGVHALTEATDPSVALFAGDDVTDEDGFKALRANDVGIKVGDKETVADYRVESIDAFGTFLTELAQARAAHLESTRD